MRTQYTVALSMLAGVAVGAVSVGGLYAQGKAPGAYAIIAFSNVGDPAAFKANVLDKAPEVIKKHGGHFVVRTRACIQLGGVCQGTEQNQTRNTVL